MDRKKRIAILGGGISGLAAAWYLQQYKPEREVTLWEKTARLGGYLETMQVEGSFIEKGPRVFKRSKSAHLLALLDELDMQTSCLPASKSAKARYILDRGILKKMPPFLLGRMILALLRESFIPYEETEESIYAWSKRRFGKTVAERMIDPLVQGVFAGDCQQLSLEACFPRLKQLEKEWGSVGKGMLFSPKQEGSLFTLAKGSQSLINALSSCLRIQIHLEEEVVHLSTRGAQVVIHTERQEHVCDHVISALPSYAVAAFFPSSTLGSLLASIPYQSLTVINVVLSSFAQLPRGMGYLVPSREKELILGVFFDSELFPSQSPTPKITILLKGIGHPLLDLLIERVLRVHLQIEGEAVRVECKEIERGIPQYLLGHTLKIEKMYKHLPPWLSLTGNYLEGVSVNDCIRISQDIAQKII